MAVTQRAHIVLPGDLLGEIDALVGPRGRSASLLKTARQEVQRRKLLRFLESEQPAWRAGDHPELAAGVAAWACARKKRGPHDDKAEIYPVHSVVNDVEVFGGLAKAGQSSQAARASTPCHPEEAESMAKPTTPDEGPMHLAGSPRRSAWAC